MYRHIDKGDRLHDRLEVVMLPSSIACPKRVIGRVGWLDGVIGACQAGGSTYLVQHRSDIIHWSGKHTGISFMSFRRATIVTTSLQFPYNGTEPFYLHDCT